MKTTPDIVKAFTPNGNLRAAINLGNPVLANRDPASGQAQGVSVDLARELAARLGVALELLVFESAPQSVQAVTQERADIGFFAIDPARGAAIAFTAAYVLIEGCYLVRQDSALGSVDEVDQAGHRVAVGQGSAYDLHLSRNLSHAQIVRAPGSSSVVDAFLDQGLEVAAGIRQQLEMDAGRIPGLRLLPGRFMLIQQAMGLSKGRGSAAAAALSSFVEAMKASGFVAQALARHGIQGASVAPLAGA
jgi:polar amino acid transport system substrate-binding protein